ncbi:MAG: MFS transporter [Nitrospinae bacterium]|nr:MFS transporter [Nitrospinota bacterium]
MPYRKVKENHKNSLYLLSALTMIYMTMIVALQPLFLHQVFRLSVDNAGFINATIHVATEVADLLFVGYLGYLSDRHGRIPVIVYGFLFAGVMALFCPFSMSIGAFFGVSGLAFYYLFRIGMSMGSTAVWPQIAALAGDFSSRATRPKLVANAGFMMAFGATLSYAVLMQIPKEVGVTWVVYLVALIAFVGAWIASRFLVEVAPRQHEKILPFRAVKRLVLRERKLKLTFLAALTSRNDMVVIGLFLMIWFIYFAELLGIGHADAAARAGMMIGYLGLVVLVSIPFWGLLIDRLGRVTALAIGLGLSGAGLIGFGLVVNPFEWWVLIPATIVGLGQGGCLLAPQTLTIDMAPENSRGTVLGAFNTVGCIGVIIFLQTGGVLFDAMGPPAPFILTGIANLSIMGYALYVLAVEGEGASDEATEDGGALADEAPY